MKSTFCSVGPNWVLSMDGHDKLMGYQSSAFPLAVHGYSQSKIIVYSEENYCLLIKIICLTYPARWYFEYLCESKTLPDHIRIEKGLETTIMATMQEFLSNKGPNILTSDETWSTVICRPSTSIQLGVYMYFNILVFPYTLKSGIDVSPAINLSEIFHSGFYYPVTSFIYFWNNFQTRQLLFTSCLFAEITISLHCIWKRMILWFSDSSWGDFAFDFRTHTHTHTHKHTHTHYYSSHLLSRSRNIVKVI